MPTCGLWAIACWCMTMRACGCSGPGFSALRVSPDGTHLLVGEIRELHTAEEHGVLVQADARGAEEEVRWSVLDGQLQHPKLMGNSSTYRLPPILLDEGMVELRKEAADRYHLVMRSWEASAEEQLGSFESTCVPSLESTPPDLLILSTCDSKDLGYTVSSCSGTAHRCWTKRLHGMTCRFSRSAAVGHNGSPLRWFMERRTMPAGALSGSPPSPVRQQRSSTRTTGRCWHRFRCLPFRPTNRSSRFRLMVAALPS